MAEAVRLIIWDLDQTFWRGTLTEGGVCFVPEHGRIVAELARRGIVSSICSKNGFDAAKQILVDNHVWDFFVLPSVSWEPKGARIQALVETIGLRPETVLFIDDNPSQLQEAKALLPQLQIADETIIARLLDDPRMKGKADDALSRLRQYKLLEQRAEARRGADDGLAFLRASDIRVSIHHNVEDHLERVIELINRTNQLNFTKWRLPANVERAKAELLAILSTYNVQAGLVRVRDNYGDHGFCGFYMVRKAVEDTSGLLHFCFSCRILGMGVETWLYRRLGRPRIRIADGVLTDLFDEAQEVDWIRLDDADANAATAIAPRFARVRVRGGCEMMAVSHYLNFLASDMIGEFAFNRDNIQIRIEHSLFLRYALTGPPPGAMASFSRLGFRAEDFETGLFEAPDENEPWVLSFWGDATYPVYRHKELGALIPFNAAPATPWTNDFSAVEPHQIKPDFRDHWIVGALQTLKQDYEAAGLIGEAQFKENVGLALARIPAGAPVILLGANEGWTDADGRHISKRYADLNAWCRDIAAEHGNVEFLDFTAMLAQSGISPTGLLHFERRVYFGVYERIAAALLRK